MMKFFTQNRTSSVRPRATHFITTFMVASVLFATNARGQTNMPSPGCGCVWDVSLLPITVHPGPGFFGQIAFDGNCDLLVAGGRTHSLYKVDHLTGDVTTLVTNLANAVTSVLYRPSDGFVYAAAGDLFGGQIFRVNGDGTVTILTSSPGLFLATALAPDSFGAFGNQIIASRYPGMVLALDPDTLKLTQLAQASGNISALAFDPSGFLYVADRTHSKIQLLWPDGASTDFLSFPFETGLNGLAIDPLGSRLFAAISGSSQIQRVTLLDSSVAPVRTLPLNADIRPTGLLVDAGGHLLVKTSSNTNAVIDFVTVNVPPSASAEASPLYRILADDTNLFILSPNNAHAAVILDGSQSSDADNDPLQLAWYTDGQTDALATGAVATNQFAVGPHTVRLVVNDGHDTATAQVSFEVITPATAVGQLVQLVNNAELGTRNKQPLLATLFAAMSSFDHGEFTAAFNQLSAFQNKVRAQLAPWNPALADLLTTAAQQIIAVMRERQGESMDPR